MRDRQASLVGSAIAAALVLGSCTPRDLSDPRASASPGPASHTYVHGGWYGGSGGSAAGGAAGSADDDAHGASEGGMHGEGAGEGHGGFGGSGAGGDAGG